MTFSIIQKSQLEGAQRIDAEYYQPEYLHALRKLKSLKYKKLKDIAYITDGEHGSPIFDENSGIKYYSAQHVKDFLIDSSSAKSISKTIDEKNKRSRLQVGDVLLSTVGTIGFAGLVTNEILPANIDRHVARIALKEKTITPEMLTIYLNSKYGKLQSMREATGNVQLNLFIDKIKEFVIPDLLKDSSTKILFDEALDQLNESKAYYQQAEDLLLEELGLTDFDQQNDLFSIVQYTHVITANRNDAEYYQPKYLRLFEAMKKKNPKRLGDLVSISKGFEPGSEAYREEGKLFIRVSSLTKNGIVGGDQKHLNDELYQKLKGNFEPKVGEILLTKDASPGIAYALKEQVEGIISGGILKLKLKQKIDPEYLALVMNSLVGQMQAERDAGGSVIAHWKPEQIKNVVIPILPDSVTGQIVNFVVKSHTARQKSKELLAEAKRKVEEMIEKGGE